MQQFELDGTLYRIILVKGEDWRDCSRDQVQRWNPEQKAWLPSGLPASRLRSFGTPRS